MKITCDREKLASAFQIAATVANARSPKEILQNVKIEAAEDRVTLMATDMETGIPHRCGRSRCAESWSRPPAVARVGLILRESSDQQLSFEVAGTETVVQGLNATFKLPSANPDEYTNVVGFEEEAYHELAARLFKEMVKRTSFATDVDSSRYALGGVLMEMTGEEVWR